MFAVLHRRDAYRNVELPRCGVIYEVNIFFGAHPPEIVRSSRIQTRFGLTCIDSHLLGPKRVFFANVADCHEPCTRNRQKILYVRRTHSADPHEPDADFGHRWCCKWFLRTNREDASILRLH